MMLDDLLALLPGLRRVRSLNADWLRVLTDRQKGECTWCGQPVAKGRSTWCSDDCVKAFKLRCCPNTAAAFAEKRDNGICQKCGRDCRKAERDARAEGLMRHRPQLPGETPYEYRRVLDAREKRLREEFGYARGRWSEIDHLVPVVLGGGLCDPAGLRTVCGACHLEATNQLAGSRRKKKS